MTWARFDDRYPTNRKVRPLSDAAFRLDVSGICWASENTTDGRVPADDLSTVSDVKRPAAAAAELVRRNRWHTPGHTCTSCQPIEDGWIIHDYLGYNPAAEKVQREREAKAERQRRWLESRRGKPADVSTAPPTDPPPDAPRDASLTHAPSPSPSPTTGGARDAPRCPRHTNTPNPPPCGPCADARRNWHPPAAPADTPAAAILGAMPEHDPDTAAAGRAAARAALNRQEAS